MKSIPSRQAGAVAHGDPGRSAAAAADAAQRDAPARAGAGTLRRAGTVETDQFTIMITKKSAQVVIHTVNRVFNTRKSYIFRQKHGLLLNDDRVEK